MKRLSIFLLLCFFAIASMAQVEHLKFMGISIDGKISAFQKELKKKGFVLNELTKYLPKNSFSDCRFYNGVFAGEYVDLVVYFDKETKIVNQTKVHIVCHSEYQVDKIYEKFYNSLKEKYDNDRIEIGITDEPDKYSFGIFNSDKTAFLGFIYLGKVIDSYNDKYSVGLEYYDTVNYSKGKDRILNDF